ncbi:MAG: ParB N-terminal domain-containing protein [bacterium]
MVAIPLGKIIQHKETQPRVTIDEAIVDEYSEDMKQGAVFPAIDVFQIDGHYVIVDGYHRYHAALKAGLTGLDCTVFQGTIRDAILYALGANANHGFRRTNEDKRIAVEKMLKDPEWSTWSDGMIATKCHVSDVLVRKLRSESLPKLPSFSPSGERKYVTKNGHVATMKTANIGKEQKKSPFQTGKQIFDHKFDDHAIAEEKAAEIPAVKREEPPTPVPAPVRRDPPKPMPVITRAGTTCRIVADSMDQKILQAIIREGLADTLDEAAQFVFDSGIESVQERFS